MAPAIGIDLGTSCSCVAVYEHGRVEVISNSQGHLVTPSCVAFTKTERLAGDEARNQKEQNPENTIYDAKRVIGRYFSDIPDYDIKRWAFKVINEKNKPKFEVDFKNVKTKFSPEQISAAVLSKMKEIAEEYLGKDVKDAVITVPAHFTDAQRQATKDAAEIAGLNVLQLINEPTAAAIAYGLNKKLKINENILVFDMGGGTFDVSILTIDKDTYHVKAVGGDNHLGGEDFNNKMLDYFIDEFKSQNGEDLSCDKNAKVRLLIECEKAKITLSTSSVATIQVNSLFNGIDFKSSITRARFENLNETFFAKSIKIVEETIAEAKLSKEMISEVVLVGGSTYIPKVQQMLQDCFSGKTLNKSVKPDEAVAYGAAVYASVLSGDDDAEDLVILDVTPLSLGIAHGNGQVEVIVKRNSSIPLKVTYDKFSNSRENQSEVNIKVYEGEHLLRIKNKLLGKFVLANLPNAPAQSLRISVTFEITADGILKVYAEEKSKGIKNMINVNTYKEGLNEDVSNQILAAESSTADELARIDFMKRTSIMKQIKELSCSKVEYENGMRSYETKDYDAAFESFTKVLKSNERNIEAMEKRAEIHFLRNEYEECVIECEEICAFEKLDRIKTLLEKSKKNIRNDKKWYTILEVAINAQPHDVEASFRRLAKTFHPKAKSNYSLIKIDVKKIELKYSKANKAYEEYKKLK